MSLVLLTIVLALGWATATGSFTLPNLMLGALVSAACLFVVRSYVSRPNLLPRALRIVALGWLFISELVASALRVARLVLRPDLNAHIRPAIIAFPLSLSRDAEITLLANLITLTPGTLSVDVSEDRRFLYIHAIHVTDRAAFIKEIASGFEAKVAGVFR
ncbi:MAG TPA: Na+/H+ antiporter subunit E [Devosia sp.]|jgi:multicomponent Na+:H+ antiporter subunit E|uniref:Na+/H+ antiporter subunit E n=1 Tax=Devosia sp. TaxID=1871048 RepID=UPI002DDD8CB1|nr:Na+/H+ antiporter subunit E [Devosia sp.]HEV2517443.1 Na+/H+ antiporter subunit E [Devosia sp.]